MSTRRARFGAGFAVVTAIGALLFGSAAPAQADDPPPPNCTAADLAGVMAGVTAGMSVYLFTHPDVNAYFTSLKGLPKDEMRAQATAYLDANPQVKAEIAGVRQPSMDFRDRCGIGQPAG
ncbi:MAG: heme-binding protein [Mycobacterium sp.]|nr:heme-binding protein [Mycobacterium sp.]